MELIVISVSFVFVVSLLTVADVVEKYLDTRAEELRIEREKLDKKGGTDEL